MDLILIVQVALGGALLGGIYGLLSLGMSLNLGLLNITNLSHGSLLILGAVVAYGLSAVLEMPPILVMVIVPLVFGVLGGLAGPLLFASLTRRNAAETLVPSLIITLGLAFILEEFSATVLGHPLIGLSSGFEPWHWQGLTLSPLALIILSLAGGIILLLGWFLCRTDLGRSLRAVSQDLEGALFVGVPLPRIRAVAWAISVGTAALAGAFWIRLYPVTPFMGLRLTVMSILMVMVVGPGQIARAIGAGFFWGLLETFGSALWGSQWGMTIPLSLYLGVLFFFPERRPLFR